MPSGSVLAQGAGGAADVTGTADVLRLAGDGTAGPPSAAGPPSPLLGVSDGGEAGRTGNGERRGLPTPPQVAAPPPALGAPERPEIPAASPGLLDATPSPAAADNEAAPSAADEPGRQDDPPPAAPAISPAPVVDYWRQRLVAEAFECPRDQVVRMLGAAVDEFEVSSSMELEREVLVLCRDRWTVLKEIMDSELSLAAVLRKDRVAREKAALELEERRRVARARIEGARQGAAEAARVAEERRLAVEAALAVPEERVEAEPEEPAPSPAEEQPVEAIPVVQTPEPEPHERYSWFTIIGAAGTLRAGVTDGEARWMVGVGDRLPGGLEVTAISARPPRVRIEDGPPSGLRFERLQ